MDRTWGALLLPLGGVSGAHGRGVQPGGSRSCPPSLLVEASPAGPDLSSPSVKCHGFMSGSWASCRHPGGPRHLHRAAEGTPRATRQPGFQLWVAQPGLTPSAAPPAPPRPHGPQFQLLGGGQTVPAPESSAVSSRVLHLRPQRLPRLWLGGRVAEGQPGCLSRLPVPLLSQALRSVTAQGPATPEMPLSRGPWNCMAGVDSTFGPLRVHSEVGSGGFILKNGPEESLRASSWRDRAAGRDDSCPGLGRWLREAGPCLAQTCPRCPCCHRCGPLSWRAVPRVPCRGRASGVTEHTVTRMCADPHRPAGSTCCPFSQRRRFV